MATKYEMALYEANGQVLSLGWTERKTKKCLWLAMRKNGTEILKFANLPHDESEAFEWNTKRKAWVWRDFAIRFSQNTKAR